MIEMSDVEIVELLASKGIHKRAPEPAPGDDASDDEAPEASEEPPKEVPPPEDHQEL